LAALYFAVNEGKHMGSDGAVWCLDPVSLNKAANLKFGFELEIPAFGRDKVLESYLPSHVQVASLCVAVGASGMANTRSVPLLTVAEMDKALGEGMKYRPPGG